MNNLFDSFSSQTLNQWQEQLVKDLKGQSEELLSRNNVIEEIAFTTYLHTENEHAKASSVWLDKYARGLQKESNLILNVKNISILSDKDANTQALQALNSGANAIRFENCSRSTISTLLQDIQLDVIQTRFVNPSTEQVDELVKNYNPLLGSNIIVEWDIFEKKDDLDQIISLVKHKQFPLFVSNGYAVQQIGANTSQEVAFILTTAHDTLCALMNKGLTIDEAAACIHFNVGVGNQYFFEIAKTRVVRMLWSKIVEQYTPASDCSKNIQILGSTGFINKSLKDPYTNLLRQTTEVASLMLGGVDAICCLPYDTFTSTEKTILASRMALNIPNILIEESYFDKVIDPYAGSYAVEYLCNQIAEKAWQQFVSYNETDGFFNTINLSHFKKVVEDKQILRKALFLEGKTKFIGINSFPNPEVIDNKWIATGRYLDMDYLVLERIEA